MTGDAAVVRAIPDRSRVRVGEEITVEVTMANRGPVPDHLDLDMSWPAGLERVAADGLIVAIGGPTHLTGSTRGKVEPRDTVTFTLVLRATAPVARGPGPSRVPGGARVHTSG